jgi:hypothetical protein
MQRLNPHPNDTEMIRLSTNTLKLAGLCLCAPVSLLASGNGDTAYIRKTVDFSITGNGSNASWDKTNWQSFVKIDSGGRPYRSRSKMLYSQKGIYLLFSGEDELISTKDYNDDEEIYEGDVFEFFLQPDPGHPGYFEYEINQLNKQLVLILSGSPHRNLAWSPWGYEYKKDPLIQKKVVIYGRSGKQPPRDEL